MIIQGVSFSTLGIKVVFATYIKIKYKHNNNAFSFSYMKINKS